MSYGYIYYQGNAYIPASSYYFNTAWKDPDNWDVQDVNECETDITFWLGIDGDTSLPPRDLVVSENLDYDFWRINDYHSDDPIAGISYWESGEEIQFRSLSFWLGIEAEIV